MPAREGAGSWESADMPRNDNDINPVANQADGRPPILPRAAQGKNTTIAPPLFRAASETFVQSRQPTNVGHNRAATCDYALPQAAPETLLANELQQPILSPCSRVSATSYSKRRVTLEDLDTTNPIETEAENAILHAIEMKNNKDNVANAMLPGAPDEVVGILKPSPRPSTQSEICDLFVGMHSHTAAKRRWTAARKYVKDQRIIDTSQTPEAELHGTKESKMDVHDKLYALTGHMLEVQEEAKEGGIEQKGESAGTPNGQLDEPITQVDNLVQNANVLFRRSTLSELDPISEENTDSESQDSEHEAKKGFLSFVHRGAKHQKKSDEQGANDIETGASSERPTRKKRITSSAGRNVARKATSGAVGDLKHFRDFLKPRKATIIRYCRGVLQWIWLPTLFVSFILYYTGNPRTCSNDGCPSLSWLFIFFLIRQVVTFTLAKVLEVFIIDFLSLRNRFTIKVFGPTITLLIVQSRGWPFILLMWSILDFVILYGNGQFANHWLFYQDAIPVFNANNPSGNVLTNQWYRSILIACVIVSCAYAVKRLWVGVHLGKRMYRQYGKQLAMVMNDMLLISLLAGIGHDISMKEGGKASRPETIFKWDDLYTVSAEEGEGGSRSFPESPGSSQQNSMQDGVPIDDTDPQDIAQPLYQSSLLRSQKIRMNKLLGDWEEPPRATELGDMSLAAMLQFKQALTYMDDVYPFSVFFGPANTREQCVASSQMLYEQLLKKTPGEFDLPFDTIALVATDKQGQVDPTRLKRLYRTFHPDPDGYIGLLDFVRSVDKVYKDLRLLRAAIANSAQIDCAFETIFNFFFAIVMAFIVLPIAGFNPFTLMVSLSGLIVGFAFMIGPASSKFFEGILFILVRRPFDIGDRINISSPNKDTSRDGSPGWFVEKVDLFSTTVRYATTNEVATYSNGSLASERVINAARSPKAVVYINLKFGIGVEFAKIEVFKTTVESFVKARTREWLALNAFRATRVEADLGFIEYVLVLQHVASWQEIGAILSSKAELASYCLEVSKLLDMHYQAPPLPVNLAISKPTAGNMVDMERADNTDAEDAKSGTVDLGATGDQSK